jgi:hypothetical protein
MFSQKSINVNSLNQPAEISMESIDKELAIVKGTKDSTVLWVNAKDLTIEGMGWSGEEIIENYTRLPKKFQQTVTPNVWALSRKSSDIHVRFSVKGTKEIQARWVLQKKVYLPQMTSQAISGLDLYIKQNDKWLYGGTAKPTISDVKQEGLLNKHLNSNEEYECMIYLPLYNGIYSLEIGFSPNAIVKKVPPLPNKSFVFYGTSIVNGCSASRPGMTFTSMLGRRFNAPIVNLGFSGNGFTEEYFGDIMGEIDASVYFLDCLPNMYSFTPEEVAKRTINLARKLRKLRPNIPIVLVEDRTHTVFRSSTIVNPRRGGLKVAYDTLQKEIGMVYYISGDNLLGNNNDATVDGSHPSDLGMYYYYQALKPVVNEIIKKK